MMALMTSASDNAADCGCGRLRLVARNFAAPCPASTAGRSRKCCRFHTVVPSRSTTDDLTRNAPVLSGKLIRAVVRLVEYRTYFGDHFRKFRRPQQ